MKNQKMNLVRTLVALFAVVSIAVACTAGNKENSKEEKTEETTENTGDQNQGGAQGTQGGTQGSGDNGNAGQAAGGAAGTPAGGKVAAPGPGAAAANTAKVEAPKGAEAAVAVAPTAAPVAEAAASAAPAISAAGGAHLGDWVMDLEALLSMPEAKEMPAEQKEMMKSMMGSMSFKFTEEKFIMNAMGKTQEVGYSITKKNGNSMTILMAAEHGGGGEAEMTVAGDKLTLTKPGQKQPMVLKRK